VARHPRRFWAITVVGLAIACLFVPTLKASGTAQTDVFLTDVDSIAGQQALTDHFPGGSGNPVVIIAPEAAAQQVVSTVAEVDGISGAPAVVTAGGAGPQASGAPPLVINGQVQIQATLSAVADGEDAENTVRAVRDAVHAIPEYGGQVLVGGNTAIQIDTVDTSARDLRVIIPVILGAVLIVLILLLRSLIASLLLVFATVLSFGAALGVSALVFNHLFDFPGADPAVPLFAFVFLVALGIDYSIFLMTRAREEVAFYGPHDGVMRGLRVTGGVITSAGIVLAATFAALSVIPILFLAQIAFIVAFGVLLDTFIVRTLLVPALAIDMGWFTWWPVRPKPTKHQLEHRGPAKIPG
jgi:RND superfamily putative drug exporter